MSIGIKSPKDLPGRFDALVQILTPRVVLDEVDCGNMQEMIDLLTSLPKYTKGQRQYLETLSILLSQYEEKHHDMDTSDLSGLDMLKHLMEENHLNADDLGKIIGQHRTMAYKILSGERALSKENIKKLCARFSVSADLFI